MQVEARQRDIEAAGIRIAETQWTGLCPDNTELQETHFTGRN